MLTDKLNLRISKQALQRYLHKKEGPTAKLEHFSKLGKGWHGTGYKLKYRVRGQEKSLILRAITPLGFGHEYTADRAKVFLLQHGLAKEIPGHVKSEDIVGLGEKDLVSVGDLREFAQLVEEVKGKEYFADLMRMEKTGQVLAEDRRKVLKLSDYLVRLHQRRWKGSTTLADSLYKRHLRDTVGHGEMLMGVLDTYPAEMSWVGAAEITKLVQETVGFWGKLRAGKPRLARIHGDYHPGNVIFEGARLRILDASRQLWGDPTDDVTSMGLNFIWLALRTEGKFTGIFRELFELFWDNYMKKTGDREVNRIAPLFFAFRGTVVAHPLFYPEQSDTVRKKIFKLIRGWLKVGRFDYREINTIL